MNSHVSLAAGLAVVVVTGLSAGLSACSRPANAPVPPGATALSSVVTQSGPAVGGMTECTKEALAEPAAGAARTLGPDNLYTVDELTCADGWAVTSGLLSSREDPSMGAPTSFVFEQEGQFWVPKDKRSVCGTNPVTTTPPPDAQIPAALFLPGCAAS